MDNTITKYRCNGCGYNYTDPKYCPHCSTPMCPSCKRTGCITNVTEMQRLVSNSVPDGKPPRTLSNGTKKPKAKRASGKKSLEALMALTNEMENKH